MNVEAFKAYLAHLETYQNIIMWSVIVGLVIAIAGIILVFVMRNSPGNEKFSVKTESGNHFHFASTFSGGLVSFSGAAIVVVALGVIGLAIPKIDGEGWKTTSAFSYKDILSAIAQNQAVLGKVKTSDDLISLSGVFLEKGLAAKIQSKGTEVIVVPKNKIDTASGIAEALGQDKVYFYPVDGAGYNSRKTSAELKQAIDSTEAKFSIETMPKN